MALTPEVRLERFLSGEKLEPVVRIEHFLADAAGYALAAFENDSAPLGSSGASVANITDAAEGVPITALKVRINPVQEGSGTPAPDNERDIVGWEEVEITKLGKNLLDPAEISEETETRITWYADDGFLLKAGTTYTFKEFHSGAESVTVYIRDLDGNTLASSTDSVSYTPAADILACFRVYRSPSIPSGLTVMLVIGSAAGEYEPYKKTVYNIPLGRIVYGGDQDVVNGKLIIDMAIATVSSFSGTVLSQTNPAITLRTDAAVGVNNTAQPKLIGNIVPTVSANYQYSNSVTAISNNSSGHIRLSVAGLETTEEYNDWLEENPLTYVYPLAAPVEIDVQALKDIKTLLGVNNIFADTGNVLELGYRVDPDAAAVAQKSLIAPVLTEMKADTNLVANDFRIYGDTLYRITASVASGSTLTPGSNCVATTVAAQLKALLNA